MLEEFYQSVYPSLFYQWIALNQSTYKKDHIHFEVSYKDSLSYILLFQMNQVIGKIVIWNNNIVEQSIQDIYGNQIFYLHFEITNLLQASHLFLQFYESLIYHNKQKIYQIALCCTGGLSSSIFVEEIQEVCKMENTPLRLTAISLMQLENNHSHFDAIYLAPQAAYKESYLMLKTHKPIYCIDATDYATKNFRNILQLIKEQMIKTDTK